MGRKHNPDLTRQDLLKAAHEEFFEWGFEGARVDSIAAKTGANKRFLYNYIGEARAVSWCWIFCATETIPRQVKINRPGSSDRPWDSRHENRH